MFEPRNLAHQLVLPLVVDPNRRTRPTYSFTRADDDFTDDDLARAYRLQPVLAALHAAARSGHGPQREDAVTRAHRLTPRELDILPLTASGMTAVAIGHARRISPRTVREHLENLYAKLDVHARLQAVEEARRLGLLPPHPQPRGAPTATIEP